MVRSSNTTRAVLGGTILIGFALFACYLIGFRPNERQLTEAVQTFDLIWLDAWGLAAVITLAAIWLLPLANRFRIWLSIGWIALYGYIVITILFGEATFGFNGFVGDQSYRQAMVLKFMTLSWFGDFYFKGLPDFYPPVYYALVAVYGKTVSTSAHEALLVGHKLIYLIAPILSYWLWARVTSGFRAFTITLCSFLLCAFDRGLPLSTPPAFVGNLLFVPWWLYYMEIDRHGTNRWRDLYLGGILGALIFATYPYPFFVGIFLTLIRSVALRKVGWLNDWFKRQEKRALSVLLATGVLSIWYWLPPLISILRYGGKPPDQAWLHLGHLGLQFTYLNSGLVSFLFLLSLGYLTRRYYRPVNRGLLLLTLAIILFYMTGTIAGGLGHPLNIPKAKEMYLFLFGPVVGFAVATLLRRVRTTKLRVAVPGLCFLLIIPFIEPFHEMVKHPMIESAREAEPPDIGFNAEDEVRVQGKVLLAGDMTVASFYPVYLFTTANQHYAHPASRWIARYNLLYLLQPLSDPLLFKIAFRRNRFDRIDYFIPRPGPGNLYQIPLLLSDYPTESNFRTLDYSRKTFLGSALFELVSHNPIFRVSEITEAEIIGQYSDYGDSLADSLTTMFRLKLIADNLDSTGSRMLSSYLRCKWEGWTELLSIDAPFRVADEISTLACYSVKGIDSTHLFIAFKAEHEILTNYEINLHLYRDSSSEYQTLNLSPPVTSDSWQQGDIVLCSCSVPTPRKNVRFSCVFYNSNGECGRSFEGIIEP